MRTLSRHSFCLPPLLTLLWHCLVDSERYQRFSAILNAESLEMDRKLRNNAMAASSSPQLVPFARAAAPSPDVNSDVPSSPLTPLSSGYPSPAPSPPAPTGSGKGKKRARDEDEVDNANGSGNQPATLDESPRQEEMPFAPPKN